MIGSCSRLSTAYRFARTIYNVKTRPTDNAPHLFQGDGRNPLFFDLNTRSVSSASKFSSGAFSRLRNRCKLRYETNLSSTSRRLVNYRPRSLGLLVHSLLPCRLAPSTHLLRKRLVPIDGEKARTIACLTSWRPMNLLNRLEVECESRT
jgi:hypothetical protein